MGVVVRDALLLFGLTRVALYGTVTFALRWHIITSGPHGRPVPSADSLHGLALVWTYWDGHRYLEIAASGYHTTYLLNWLPLYPILVRAVALGSGALVGGHPHWLFAALLVSNASMALAVAALSHRVWHETRSRPATLLAVMTLLVMPLAFFTAATYSTAVLLACVVMALAAAQAERWWVSALAVLAAALTHPTGWMLAVPLVVCYGARHIGWRHRTWARVWWRSTDWQARARQVAETTLVVTALPLGLLGVAVLGATSVAHDPLALPHAQLVFFGHAAVGPWTLVALVATNVRQLWGIWPAEVRLAMDVIPVALAIVFVSVPTRWTRLHPHERAFIASVLVCVTIAPASGGLFPDTLTSAGRYLLVVAPVVAVSAARNWMAHDWSSSGLARIGLQSGIGLLWAMQLGITILFAAGIWII